MRLYGSGRPSAAYRGGFKTTPPFGCVGYLAWTLRTPGRGSRTVARCITGPTMPAIAHVPHSRTTGPPGRTIAVEWHYGVNTTASFTTENVNGVWTTRRSQSKRRTEPTVAAESRRTTSCSPE